MSDDMNMEVTVPRSRHPLFWLDLLLPALFLVLVTILFRLYNWDLAWQSFFYAQTLGWHLADKPVFWLLYHFGNIPALIVTLGALYVLLRGFSSQSYLRWRKMALYLLIVMGLGPGLIVNSLLKDHWGRPRPRDLIEFGGKYDYEAPLMYDASSSGKSFPCGHASMGFFLFAPVFLLRGKRRRQSFYLSLFAMAFGLIIGVARNAQGGHFMSDVLWSLGLVWFISAAVFYLMRLDTKPYTLPGKVKTKKLSPLQIILAWVLAPVLVLAVGLATPYSSTRSIKWDEHHEVEQLEVWVEKGELEVSFSDHGTLNIQDNGFGLPGSKLKWKRDYSKDDSLKTLSLKQRISGWFTEVSSQLSLVVDSLSTNNISINIRKGDVSFNRSIYSPGLMLDLSVQNGDLELRLAKGRKYHVFLGRYQKLELLHPGVSVCKDNSCRGIRLNAPKGKIRIVEQ